MLRARVLLALYVVLAGNSSCLVQTGTFCRSDLGECPLLPAAVVVEDGTVGRTIWFKGAGLALSPWDMVVADFDGDGSEELFTQSIPEERVWIWELDGTLVSDFSLQEAAGPKEVAYDVRFAQLSDDETQVMIVVGRRVVDYRGLVVCDGSRTRCPGTVLPDRGQPQFPDDEPVSLQARFRADQEPFRVDISYTVMEARRRLGQLDFSATESWRTIVRIFDPAGDLVFHEILDSRSSGGSFAVIPSGNSGSEMFIVADDERIMAYRAND